LRPPRGSWFPRVGRKGRLGFSEFLQVEHECGSASCTLVLLGVLSIGHAGGMTDEPSDAILARSRQVLVGEPPENVAIVLVAYDPTWPQRFEFAKQRIETTLGTRALKVEHIGSTSVPGLVAKPIIDICVAVEDSSDEGFYVPDLEAAGYELRVREPDWHEHRMLRTAVRDVHVHVFTVGSSEIDRHLAFRDWLRANDADPELYASTKRSLAKQDWPTMQHYADAKTDVIEAILARVHHT
jgi:GrpB-like predicted nucleotidyltransferase (UPF0157 family)